jgi:sigma-B regulation protein RsbU (phosphoserine phosphatase)
MTKTLSTSRLSFIEILKWSNPMDFDKLLAAKKPPKKDELSEQDFVNFFMKFKGLLKERERDRAFWAATNENLKIAYEKLDEKDKELERAYGIIQEDLAVAEKIQQGLLPDLIAQMKDELDIALYHKQLLQVGGDYYDYFKTREGRYAIGVFDISGHGVSAALVMAYLKAQFMLVMDRFDTPKEIVDWVNAASYDFLRSVKKYTTVNFVHFHSDTIRYVCGGGFGLLVHGKKPSTFTKRDHFLGLRLKPFHEFELPFLKNDLLVLYTDGIIEAQNEKKEDYTVARLQKLIINNGKKPVQDMMKICLEDYQTFRKSDSDDITLFIIRKKA